MTRFPGLVNGDLHNAPVTAPSDSSPHLTPYVPGITIEWLRSDARDSAARELEGTMAFVDISGFTAMSERLAGQGKAGAEEVNEVMNDDLRAPARASPTPTAAAC